MPRGPQDSHGLSTTRCPTGTSSAAGPASTTVPTTSWPSTWGNEMKAVMGLSSAPSKSMRTCLVSLPQIPVMWVRRTTQSGARGRASGTSWRAIGGGHGLDRAGEEGVRVAGLELDHGLEVGEVVLEPVALDGGDDAVRHG